MLDKIIQKKQEELQQLVLPDQQDVKRESLFKSLSQPNRQSISLISEVKKASPSKGMIRENFDPIAIAKAYEEAKADAISVLTDESFFQGHRDYLTEIKKQVNIPVLRKDFIINDKQIEESLRIGADAILLIGEVLDAGQLYEYYQHAGELGLECLVEVHSYQTLENVLKVFIPKIIGINNRNLETFETSIQQTKELAKEIPTDCLLVSESGIYSHDDLKTVKSFGAKAVLVGESLMRQENVSKAIATLFGEQKNETMSS